MKYLYEFGDFQLDTKNKILTHAGEPVPLTPKVFEMLTFFVENPGRLIEKEELMARIWAESFVEESNLTFNIRQLRKALGDDAQNPDYIKTVPRHGYRFIADVMPAGSPEEKENENDEQPRPVEPPPAAPPAAPPAVFPDHFELSIPPRSLGASLPLIAAFILMITTLAGASWVWHNFPAQAEAGMPILATNFKAVRLTNTGGVYQAVISSDGKRMAYSSEINDKQSVWIRDLETSENTQLLPNSDEFYYGLNFSHDGQTIFFARGKETDKISIYRVSILGGVPKEIAGDTQGWFSVSPDDRQISFVRCDRNRDDEHCSLFVGGADGENQRRLVTRPRPIRIGDNQFSPDGKTIAFADGQSINLSKEFKLREVSVETGAEREITAQKFFDIRHLRWLSDQSGLLLTATELYQLPTKIFQVSRSSGEVKMMPKDPNYYNQISLDKRAEKMIVTQFFPDFRLWLAPAAEPGAAQIITFAQSGFVYTPSGKVVYGSRTDGSQNIWIMNGDGSEPRQLTSGQAANWQPRVSLDERFIYFASNRSGSSHVWRMNADGSNQIQISDDEGGEPIAVSPDGKEIFFLTPLSYNLKKITVERDGGFASSLVSTERMLEADLDSTGRTVAYTFRKPDGAYEIVLMSIADGKRLRSFELVEEKSYPMKIVWSKDDRSILYSTKKGSKSTIWRLSLDGGRTEKLTEMADHEITDFSFSPNGETFAFICGRWRHDAYLIEGLK